MAHTFTALRDLSEEQLIDRHDKVAGSHSPGVDYYLRELARRDQDRQTKAMLRYTWWIRVMTVVMTIATIINVFLAYLRN